MLVLQLTSSWKQLQPNGFIRLFPAHKIIGVNSFNLRTNTYYFAGGNSAMCYLGDRAKPGTLLNMSFKSNDSIRIQLSGYENKGFYQGAYLQVNGRSICLLDENKPLIGSGNIDHRLLNDYHKVPYFTAGIAFDSRSFVLRVVKNMQNYLTKYDNEIIDPLFKLEAQGDGIFSTDGSLIKADSINRIFYIYHYRNQFLALDTNLHLLYKGKTRDTVSQAKIEVSRISSEKQLTISAPPLVVNKQCSANAKWLLIHSGLKADNETKSMTENGAVIDVYSTDDGKYQFSVYLPDFGGKKLMDFRVYGQSLYALYDHYLYKYQLNF